MTDWVVSDLLALSDLTAAAQEYTTTWHTHTYTYVRMRRATKMGEGRRHCYTDGRQYGARGRTAQHGSYRSPTEKKENTYKSWHKNRNLYVSWRTHANMTTLSPTLDMTSEKQEKEKKKSPGM